MGQLARVLGVFFFFGGHKAEVVVVVVNKATRLLLNLYFLKYKSINTRFQPLLLTLLFISPNQQSVLLLTLFPEFFTFIISCFQKP